RTARCCSPPRRAAPSPAARCRRYPAACALAASSCASTAPPSASSGSPRSRRCSPCSRGSACPCWRSDIVSLMRIRAVCFDFDGTLGYMTPSHWHAYEQAAREQGIEVSAEAMRAVGVDRSWDRWITPLGVAHVDASASEEAFREVRVAIAMDRMRAAAGEAIDERVLRAAGERAADLEGEPSRYRLYEDTRPALERIKTEGAASLVVSNHLWALPEIVEGL